MATDAEWAKGYARQAQADFRAWQALEGDDHVHSCHRMLFLQMACEKLCKARLIDAGTPPADLQTSHGYVANPLPIVIRAQLEYMGEKLNDALEPRLRPRAQFSLRRSLFSQRNGPAGHQRALSQRPGAAQRFARLR